MPTTQRETLLFYVSIENITIIFVINITHTKIYFIIYYLYTIYITDFVTCYFQSFTTHFRFSSLCAHM